MPLHPIMLENRMRCKHIFHAHPSAAALKFLIVLDSQSKGFPDFPHCLFSFFVCTFVCILFYATPQRMQKAAKIKKKAVCRLFFLNANVYLLFCCTYPPWSVVSFIMGSHEVVVLVSSFLSSRTLGGVK